MRFALSLIVVLNLLNGRLVFAAEALQILPAEVVLQPPLLNHRLIVEQSRDGLAIGEVRDGVAWTVSDPDIVSVEAGQLTAVGNGTATVTAKSGTTTATAKITVKGFDPAQVTPWSFRNHVQSVLTKTGCNMGACHGAVAGKNGFKLSLRGYDPAADFDTLTRQARGRRVVTHDPGRSLILTKPTGGIPHKGGLRFEVDSPEYRVIAEWIAQGQPEPLETDARIEKLEVLPGQAVLKAGQKQQLLVRASFSDGRVEDVTRWAKFTSTNHAVCQVDDQGLVNVSGSGEGAVVAWYLAQNVTATISVPFLQPVPAEVFANAPRANFIDEQILAKLRALNVPPSGRCTDAEFLRRSTLDTLGVLPTADEAQNFLEDADPLKREKWIERLLSRPEFVDYWTYRWSDLLLVSGQKLRPDAIKAYSQWIRQQVAENVPWDEFVRRVIVSQGSTIDNGAANFYAIHQDPLETSETVSMAFLGMAINCARCHDHPLEKWTNDDYYGMANMFARVRGKGWGGDTRNGDGRRTVFVVDRGELLQPRTGRPQPPRPLEGTPIAFDDPRDRRVPLANWLTSPRNPYFTKAIVNRVWANFFGVGLVEAVDDLRLTNPPSHPELFTALANDLVDHNYDLKALMRRILQSEAYQRSSETVPGNEADQRFYAHAYPRRLSAEILLDGLSQVTGVPTEFKDYPKGTRALQLPDASVASYFLSAFGRPERVLTCECERTEEPSMTQVLHLVNGKTLLEKLEAKAGRLAQQLEAETPPDQLIDQLYLAALTRFPRPEEKQRLTTLLQATPAEDLRTVMEDLYWSVLTSREFLFQH